MKNTEGKSVLVVDDSALMRMLIIKIIDGFMQGISVTEAVNGIDGITKMRAQDFDLVLTDMVMPEMDGLQMVNEIRRSLNNTVPVVIITTKGEEKERNLGLSHGADGYITKPVNARELREAVLRFLR